MDKVSSKLSAAGEIVATMTVLLLPPKLSFSSHVKTESRYGTNLSLFFVLPDDWSANLDITKPNVVKDLQFERKKPLNLHPNKVGNQVNELSKIPAAKKFFQVISSISL